MIPYFLKELLYAMLLGFFTQNLCLSMGIASGNMLKLSDKNFKGRKEFWIIMLLATLASAMITWFIDVYLLINFQLGFLRPLCFLFIIIIIELATDIVLTFAFPLYRIKLGNLLPSAFLNTGVFAILLLNSDYSWSMMQSALFAVMSVIGYGCSVLLIYSMRERFELVRPPSFLKGAPLALLAAGILSLIIYGAGTLNFPFI